MSAHCEAGGKRNVIEMYTFCCEGLKLMPTLESKRFLVRLAMKIHSLMNPQPIIPKAKAPEMNSIGIEAKLIE